MKVIKPLEVTSAKLLNSNVPENDYAEWVSGTSYAQGQKVMRGSVHQVFERLVAGAGTTPPEQDKTNWVFVSYTNRWRMFDQKGGSSTSQTSSIDVTIKPFSIVDSLCLFGLEAESVQVIMTDPIEGEVFNQTYHLYSYYGVVNWWRYFFEPIVKPTVMLVNLPAYSSANVRVVVTSSTIAKVGSLVLGKSTKVGDAQYGTTVGVTSYSIKERDKFGNISIVPRAYADKARYSLKISPDRTDYVKRFLTGIRDVPCVYIGEEGQEATYVYGFYKELDLVYTSYAYSDYVLEVEGLV